MTIFFIDLPVVAVGNAKQLGYMQTSRYHIYCFISRFITDYLIDSLEYISREAYCCIAKLVYAKPRVVLVKWHFLFIDNFP